MRSVSVASYLVSLHLALLGLSRSEIQRRFAARGREGAADWLLERTSACTLTVSLLRTASRLLFFGLVLVGLTGLGPESKLTAESLVVAGLVSLVFLWVFSSVLASAVARHAGPAVVSYSWPLLKVMAVIGRPLEVGLSFVDEIVRRLSGANLKDEDTADADLRRSIEDRQLEGSLDEDAAELLENVMEFGTTDVGEVMTPRTDIKGIELTDDLAVIRQFALDVGHSRVPVFRENLDHIVGILYVKDLMPFLGREADDFHLERLLRQPIVVPATKSVRDLLSDFQHAGVHMAMVIDEYGGTAGLVTIEDVLEELVGEIHDEHDPEEELPEIRQIDESHAEVDGRYHIDDLNEQLDLDLPEDEEYDTVGGFLLASLGRVPAVGESFETERARFTALEASPTHVSKISVELRQPVRVNGEHRNGNGNGSGNGNGNGKEAN
jgi:CBS domain containing-hemolysin-like protein